MYYLDMIVWKVSMQCDQQNSNVHSCMETIMFGGARVLYMYIKYYTYSRKIWEWHEAKINNQSIQYRTELNSPTLIMHWSVLKSCQVTVTMLAVWKLMQPRKK